jgi:hypothetical protein
VPLKRARDASRRRLLMAWSAAAGEVPASEHIDAIGGACRATGWDFKPARDVIQHASVGKLADALDQANSDGTPVVALHLLCHAGRAGRTWGLMLNGDEADEEGVAVDSWRLRQLLAPHADTLRLVVLAACGSAHGREFDSVTQALHRAGIQSVVASRFPLSVPGAIRAAQTLYDAALTQQATLEEAVLLTRKQLARDAVRLDWAGLQLYARAADGHETRPFRAPWSEVTAVEGPPSGTARVDLDRLDLPALLELQTQVRGALSSQFVLPSQDIIAFGRTDALVDGTRANDVVLTHPDREAQLAISRWHFVLRRTRRGHMLRSVSSQLTEVDGKLIEPGEEVQVRPGTTVRLAQVMTLRFLGSEQAHSARDAVTLQH